MIIEKSFPSNAWVISSLVSGYLITQRYIGYTKREAITAFKHSTKEATCKS